MLVCRRIVHNLTSFLVLVAGGYDGASAFLGRARVHTGLRDRVYHSGIYKISNDVALCLDSDHTGVHVCAQDRLLLRDDAATPKLLVQTTGAYPAV